MRKGRIRITNRLIANALHFPSNWKIEDISQSTGKYGTKYINESVMLISGPDFPETNNRGDAEDCKVLYHEERKWVEVKKS